MLWPWNMRYLKVCPLRIASLFANFFMCFLCQLASRKSIEIPFNIFGIILNYMDLDFLLPPHKMDPLDLRPLATDTKYILALIIITGEDFLLEIGRAHV